MKDFDSLAAFRGLVRDVKVFHLLLFSTFSLPLLYRQDLFELLLDLILSLFNSLDPMLLEVSPASLASHSIV